MELPTAWKKAEPSGNPLDAGTPPDQWDKVAHPRNPRQEVRRWVRGRRYVRICLVDDPEREGEEFAIHVGFINNPDSDQINCCQIQTIRKAVKESIKLMKLGGY